MRAGADPKRRSRRGAKQAMQRHEVHRFGGETVRSHPRILVPHLRVQRAGDDEHRAQHIGQHVVRSAEVDVGAGRVYVVEGEIDAVGHEMVLAEGSPEVDTEANRFDLVLLLAQGGRIVRDALALLRGFKPDVVLLDLGLPGGLDGAAVAERIRSAEGDRVFIIALTGWAPPNERAKALQAGANAFFLKPPDLKQLQKTIARASDRLTKQV